jgi:hypothetical protein
MGILKTATLLKTDRVGRPEELNQFPSEYVPQWYYPCVFAGQEKNRGRVGHPRYFRLRNRYESEGRKFESLRAHHFPMR